MHCSLFMLLSHVKQIADNYDELVAFVCTYNECLFSVFSSWLRLQHASGKFRQLQQYRARTNILRNYSQFFSFTFLSLPFFELLRATTYATHKFQWRICEKVTAAASSSREKKSLRFLRSITCFKCDARAPKINGRWLIDASQKSFVLLTTAQNPSRNSARWDRSICQIIDDSKSTHTTAPENNSESIHHIGIV